MKLQGKLNIGQGLTFSNIYDFFNFFLFQKIHAGYVK